MKRVVLDNTSLAVKDVLAGRERVQTEAFEAFRGAYPFRAEFCAPAKGWENGPVEGINNKLPVIARRAYGFHTPAPLIAMLFLCCGGIELSPPLPIRV